MNDLRQSGRTTRMLQAAIESARAGSHTIVYGASIDHAKSLHSICVSMSDGAVATHDTIRIKHGSILFDSVTNEYFDWFIMGSRTHSKDTVVYVDHRAIERHRMEILRHQHRFDKTYPTNLVKW